MSCIDRKASTSVPYGTSSESPCLSIESIVFQKRLSSRWIRNQRKHSNRSEQEESEELIEDQPKQAQEQKNDQDQWPTPTPSINELPVNLSLPSRMRLKFDKFYINPLNKFYYTWLSLFAFCYLYNLIFLIARSAFWLLEEREYGFVWQIVDYFIVDMVYLIDIVLKFLTGYLEDGLPCPNKPKIAKRYVQTIAFKIDLLSLVPTDLIYLLIRPEYRIKRILAALRLNRLLKISRYLEFLNLTETETKYPTAFRLSNLILNILITMHWNACIYFTISSVKGFGSDSWVYPSLTLEDLEHNQTQVQNNNILFTDDLDSQYIYCFWWSVQTLTTIAEVPEPTNSYQEMFMSILLMIGVVILAITIGSAADMVENANRQSLDLQQKCDFAKLFLKQHKIYGELEARIKNYLDYLWIAKNVDLDEVLNVLPNNLRKEIAMNVHMDTLKRVHVFQDCEPGLLEELVTKLKLQIYSPGDYVCRKGDVGHEMYFIKTGALQVVSPDGSQVYATLGSGAAFGEISILDIPGNKNGNKRTANIRSVGFSDVFQLSKKDLWEALSEYPVAKKNLIERGKALLRKDKLLDEEIAEKIERRQKPLDEQIELFQKEKVQQLSKKLDIFFNSYNEFLRECKANLFNIEKHFDKK
ncbi:cyclic nucleotide-gated olfactory channel [Brachionus plicatilis]|uniref:Cyclic nucleotide-gated olfactory channel n=1 Tax=Brachionus plicatilis TaxID=10195 RepID=A0A3M7P8X5_BRAPC|nr:cyclic nucleotide-gated olfactory channel [Brachionus plicatilis]